MELDRSLQQTDKLQKNKTTSKYIKEKKDVELEEEEQRKITQRKMKNTCNEIKRRK